MSVSIHIDNVVKKYGDHTVIDGLSLDVRPGEFFTLLGPAGCGKTTLLRMIIGFNSIEGGEIRIGDRRINDVPPNQRNMGMVFQNYAIFPHMSVRDNVAFGLKMRGVSAEEIDRRVDEILRVVKIDALRDRMPTALSGGQQQRVALARAIVIAPEVLLMDEPLSNLDAKLRVQMRTEIAKLHHRLGTTIIYVTHDQTEAMTLGTRIVVMKDGVVQQVDTPQNLYDKPCNLFVAGFMGSPQMNFLDGVVAIQGETAYVKVADQQIELPPAKSKKLIEGKYDGKTVTIGIRPEDVDDSEMFVNVAKATFESTINVYELLGAEVFLYFDIAGQPVTARVDARTTARPGDKVKVGFDVEKIHVFDKETEKVITN